MKSQSEVVFWKQLQSDVFSIVQAFYTTVTFWILLHIYLIICIAILALELSSVDLAESCCVCKCNCGQVTCCRISGKLAIFGCVCKVSRSTHIDSLFPFLCSNLSFLFIIWIKICNNQLFLFFFCIGFDFFHSRSQSRLWDPFDIIQLVTIAWRPRWSSCFTWSIVGCLGNFRSTLLSIFFIFPILLPKLLLFSRISLRFTGTFSLRYFRAYFWIFTIILIFFFRIQIFFFTLVCFQQTLLS